MKFQREIEKAASEKNRAREWQLRQRRSSSHSTPTGSKLRLQGSMDSLLSGDSDYSSGRSMQQHQLGGQNPPPPLPPKSKYVSSENLSPPKLPPKKKINNGGPSPLAPSSSSGMKRVSISMQEVSIVGRSGKGGNKMGSEMNLADDEDSHESLEGDEEEEEVVEDPEEEEEESFDDSLATLPSVRELASKFMPKKSPEPILKKSINKVTNIKHACISQTYRSR